MNASIIPMVVTSAATSHSAAIQSAVRTPATDSTAFLTSTGIR
jgi:hypothetical protein